jgi:hypothetical protein
MSDRATCRTAPDRKWARAAAIALLLGLYWSPVARLLGIALPDRGIGTTAGGPAVVELRRAAMASDQYQRWPASGPISNRAGSVTPDPGPATAAMVKTTGRRLRGSSPSSPGLQPPSRSAPGSPSHSFPRAFCIVGPAAGRSRLGSRDPWLCVPASRWVCPGRTRMGDDRRLAGQGASTSERPP